MSCARSSAVASSAVAGDYPSLGVLNDNEGPPEIFVPPDTFRRNLQIAREAGVSEVWIFGANGLNDDYLRALRETLPLEPGD